MDQYSTRCLRSLAELESVERQWNEFTERHFPGNYNRTHAWLCAWWGTYHHNQPARVYIRQRQSDGAIGAVAPLFIAKELLGGLPILSLQSLGVGLGTDDFLCGPDSRGFVDDVLRDLVQNQCWHVARLRRISDPALCREVVEAATALSCRVDDTLTDDFYIKFPATFQDYLQSRSKKFRRNLRQAMNKLEKEGPVTYRIFDPITDRERVWAIGKEVSATSWQFQQGKSHFNDRGGDDFYVNLARQGHGAGGEEFVVLMVGERPVAYLLGCLRDRTYFAVDTAFSADYRTVSAGRLLFNSIIERLIEQGSADFFDFEGSGEYKDDYATDVRKVNFVTIYNRSLYPRFIRWFRSSRTYEILGRIRHRSDHN